ncbi:MAG: hypothetical protein HY291_24190 [Planctomycetes bacterium]|nr:hypothetical protein [Planctomycetota bacterium]
MAEAPKTTRAPAPAAKSAAAGGKAGASAKGGPNPMLPVIAIALILGGAIWMTYSIITEPPPKKKPGGH